MVVRRDASPNEVLYHHQRMTKAVHKISNLMHKILPDAAFAMVMIQSPTNVQVVAGSETDPEALKAILLDGLSGLQNVMSSTTFQIDPDDPDPDESEEGVHH